MRITCLAIVYVRAYTNNILVTYGALQVSYCIVLYCNLLNEVSSIFWYFEVRVRYRRKTVHVRYLISRGEFM